jgi:predicted deacylase
MAAAGLLAGLLAGCAGARSGAALSAAAAAVDASTLSRRSVAGHSVEGRPIEVIRLGDGPATILLLATIHGDEDAGTPLMDRLAAALIAEP